MSTELSKPQNEGAFVRPRVDVFENESEYLVVADLPGVAVDAVDVHFEDGELRLEARRAKNDDPGALVVEEYKVADYRRAFAMPEGVDHDKIAASLANGILEVHLPKAAGTRARKIAVKAS